MDTTYVWFKTFSTPVGSNIFAEHFGPKGYLYVLINLQEQPKTNLSSRATSPGVVRSLNVAAS